MAVNTKAYLIFLISCLMASSCKNPNARNKQILTAFESVDPLIGTGGHGHTFPGAARPFGMVQLSPDTYNSGWDWCSGYHYSDSSIMGFSHTHLSGTGRGDLLDVLIMPGSGRLHFVPGSRENPDEGYRSRFDHSQEFASPGYYSVLLKDYGIRAELTATVRAGFHRYTFPESEDAHILIDLFHGYATDSVIETCINIVNDSLITGYRKSRGWGEGDEEFFAEQEVYFAAAFSKPFVSSGIAKDLLPDPTQKTAVGRDLKAYVTYATNAGEQVLVKVGISSVDIDGAINNLNEEITDWDFDRIRNEAKAEWESELEKISIEDADESLMRTFYTALYHTMIAPYQFSDVDGRYRGFDKKIHRAVGFTNYTVFSLWDTFRAANPLNTIIQTDRVAGMINAFLHQYNEYGLLPVWTLWGSETNCMIGYHAIPVIADAYLKGIPGIDMKSLYPAIKKSAMQDEFGIRFLKEYGYIPMDKDKKSVSKTLEYAFDDWCIAQIANELGKEEDYRYFMKRSQSFVHLFDSEYQLMNGKSSDGTPRRPFDATYSSYGPSDFIEGNSWQYSFFVPHDMPGLISLYGGKESFANKLEELFTMQTSSGEPKPLDVTGLIGEYAHGNEPSHHVAYLFNFADRPEKSQFWLNKIMTSLYNETPEGLCGNEDCGQMSAWYVFSAMGFYPVNPASGNYELGSPIIKKARLKTGNNTLLIEAKNLSDENIYVKKVILNGKVLNRHYITHKEILEGGTLEFHMGNTL